MKNPEAQSALQVRRQRIGAELEQLIVDGANDIAGAAAVTLDGIVVVARMAGDVNVERVGAVAATILGVTRRVATELRIGAAEETILKADRGLFMIVPAGAEMVLAVTLRPGANLGMVRLETRGTAATISQIA